MALTYYSEGPAGPQGPTGPQGPAGPAGAAGTNGTNGTNGQGVPTGGTAGQVLSKINTTDYNTQWVSNSYAGWPKFKAGLYYYSDSIGASVGTLASTGLQGDLFFTPITVRDASSFDSVSVNCRTAGAGLFARLGLYNSDVNGFPSTLVVDAGQADLSSTGLKDVTVSTTNINPGLYWLCLCYQGTVGAGGVTNVSGNNRIPKTTLSGVNNGSLLVTAAYTAGLPSDATGLTFAQNDNTPHVALRGV